METLEFLIDKYDEQTDNSGRDLIIMQAKNNLSKEDYELFIAECIERVDTKIEMNKNG